MRERLPRHSSADHEHTNYQTRNVLIIESRTGRLRARKKYHVFVESPTENSPSILITGHNLKDLALKTYRSTHTIQGMTFNNPDVIKNHPTSKSLKPCANKEIAVFVNQYYEAGLETQEEAPSPQKHPVERAQQIYIRREVPVNV